MHQNATKKKKRFLFGFRTRFPIGMFTGGAKENAYIKTNAFHGNVQNIVWDYGNFMVNYCRAQTDKYEFYFVTRDL